jgi:hypothetical protein
MKGDGWQGFWRLGGLNLLVALLCFVPVAGWALALTFPLAHLAWSVPLILAARRRHSREHVQGMIVAAALTSLAACGCWAVLLGSI